MHPSKVDFQNLDSSLLLFVQTEHVKSTLTNSRVIRTCICNLRDNIVLKELRSNKMEP